MKRKPKQVYKVRVRLVAEEEIEMEVSAREDEDPAFLTPHEERRAISLASGSPHWSVDRAEVIK